MTIVPPEPGEPRRPHGPRNPGDTWVVADTGERYWGRFGAAGLLALDPQRGVLLQHRVAWSHFGDTWGSGGARHAGESRDGALRESTEEAGVPPGAVRARLISVFDVEVWTYSTVVADVTHPFEPVISDPESRELAWVPVDEVDGYPLHPGFEASWPMLRAAAGATGARDRRRERRGLGARRLVARSRRCRGAAVDLGAGPASAGVDAAALGLAGERWFPEASVVVEGQARGAAEVDGIRLVRAEGHGDDAIVAEAERLAAEGRTVTVVTSDRELSRRADAVGAAVRPVSWLRDQL